VDLKDKAAIEKLVGKPDEYGSLYLRGPFLAKRVGQSLIRYFPQPADAIVDGLNLTPARLSQRTSTLKTSGTLQIFGLEQKSGKQKEPLWLDETSLMKYLGGETVKGTKASDLFLREERVGIGMNERRVVDEGMLYETEFIRPCDGVGLLVEMDGYDDPQWEQGGILSLGGEGKQASFEKVNAAPLASLPSSASRFKMYFATPTYFENGWLPKDWSKFFKGKVDLLGAAINRYESVGGFNWVNDDPNGSTAHRPARRFVPAGSVYYFDGAPQLQENLVQQAVTDFGAQIGFGQIIITEVTNHV
jgi:CRISPR-associated protein Cmr3